MQARIDEELRLPRDAGTISMRLSRVVDKASARDRAHVLPCIALLRTVRRQWRMLRKRARATFRRNIRRPTMPAMIPAVVAMIAALLIDTRPVAAQNYPWCAYKGEGGTNCGFVSYEQCREGGRWCDRNPMYRPPAVERDYAAGHTDVTDDCDCCTGRLPIILRAKADDAKEAIMRIAFLIGAVGVATLFDLCAAQAYYGNGPWCAVQSLCVGTVTQNCTMLNFEQCRMETIAGNRGFCIPNPYWPG